MKDEDSYGIPDDLRVPRRPYTMTPAALTARRNNAALSTGPKTDEGKKASSRNSWKHGLYAESFILGAIGKPCQSTCEQYESCSLVADGQVSPGETCLDKQFVAEAFEAIHDAIQNKRCDDFNGIASLHIAGALQILRQCQEAILTDGVVVKSIKIDKDGHSIGEEYKPHPALAVYSKMLVDLGLTPQDFMLTPREIARAEKKTDTEEAENVAGILSRAFKNLAGPKPGNDDNR